MASITNTLLVWRDLERKVQEGHQARLQQKTFEETLLTAISQVPDGVGIEFTDVDGVRYLVTRGPDRNSLRLIEAWSADDVGVDGLRLDAPRASGGSDYVLGVTRPLVATADRK